MPAAQQACAGQALFFGHEAMALGAGLEHARDHASSSASPRLHLRRQVKDPWLRRQLTPDFRPGCKRMLMTSDYYPALQRGELQADHLADRDASARTASAPARASSTRSTCIVFATGFEVSNATAPPFPVTGRDGRALGEEWAAGAYAYKSVHVAGYPNLFFTFGPNSGPGHNSALVYMESQLDYAVDGDQDHPRSRPAQPGRAAGPRRTRYNARHPAAARAHDLELRVLAAGT